MTAPSRIYTPENGDTVEYIRADLHQSALTNRDREIAHLQARLKACPTVEQLREWQHCSDCPDCRECITETANRMEAANAE